MYALLSMDIITTEHTSFEPVIHPKEKKSVFNAQFWTIRFNKTQENSCKFDQEGLPNTVIFCIFSYSWVQFILGMTNLIKRIRHLSNRNMTYLNLIKFGEKCVNLNVSKSNNSKTLRSANPKCYTILIVQNYFVKF